MDSVVARFEKLGAASNRSKARLSKWCGCRSARRCCSWISPANSKDCMLLYGHMDKQPEMTGWRAGLGAWEPMLEGEQPVRTRRRRRRLRDVRVSRRDRRAGSARHPACAMRRGHRGVRGKRQLRSARLHRASGASGSGSRVSSSRSTPDAATTSSYGARPRCAAWSAGTLTVEVLTEGVAFR